jgi:hypothetical protein
MRMVIIMMMKVMNPANCHFLWLCISCSNNWIPYYLAA